MKYITMQINDVSLDVVIDQSINIVDVYPSDSSQSIKAILANTEILNTIKEKIRNGEFYLTQVTGKASA